MTDLLAFTILSGVGDICLCILNIHSNNINETTDRVRNLRDNEKDDKYLTEIIKIQKKRKKNLIKRHEKISLSKKNGLNFR